MPTAEAVARYFLHLAAKAAEPSPLTQLQLHKLVYYAQGWMLATRDRALFSGDIQAWVHGPVVKEMHPVFAAFKDQAIPANEGAVDASLSGEDRGLIESVWLGYGKYSAWRLREMTHAERPWREARGLLKEGEPGRSRIETEVMRAYFRDQHQASLKRMGLDPDEFEASLREAREGKTIAWEDFKASLLAEAKPASDPPGLGLTGGRG